MIDVPDSKYQVQFYPGNTQGQVLFIIYLKDDYYLDSESAIARLYIDGEEQSYKNIIIQCERKINFNKFMVNPNAAINQNNYLLQSFNFLVIAGQPFSINTTAI